MWCETCVTFTTIGIRTSLLTDYPSVHTVCVIQQSIPVGCVLPTCQLYVLPSLLDIPTLYRWTYAPLPWTCSPPDIPTTMEIPTLTSDTWWPSLETYPLPASKTWWLLLETLRSHREQTHTCENITLPQQ